MFLINVLTQHCKFTEPFWLPVYRVCMKRMVVQVFWSPCTQFSSQIFLLNTTGKRSSRRLIWMV